MNPEDVKKAVKEEVHDLIREHQRLPGSILHGIMQRCVFSILSYIIRINTCKHVYAEF